MSFIMLYANGEFLQMIGTENVVDAKSLMTNVISQTAIIPSVVKFCHCHTRHQLLQLKSFRIDMVLQIYLTSNVAFLKK